MTATAQGDRFTGWAQGLDLDLGRDARRAVAALLGLFAIALLWGAFAPLSGAVAAGGVIAARGKNVVVQHLEGGVVARVLVREGETVRQGQPLISLDPVAAGAALQRIRLQLDAARALEARLVAERDGRSAIAFPADLLARGGEPHVARAIASQRNEFAARRGSLTASTSVFRQQIAALQEEVQGAAAQRVSVAEQSRLIADELADARTLYEKGYGTKPRVLALERAAVQLQGTDSDLAARAAQARQTIAEVQNRILALEREFAEKAVSDLRTVQIQVGDLQERMTASSDVVRRLAVRAPVGGRVLQIRPNEPGAVIAPGDAVAEIVPSGAGLVVEARVQPGDVEQVRVGQETELRFTAFGVGQPPIGSGKVLFVSPDRLVDSDSGMSYFVVRIAIAAIESDRVGLRDLAAGMPVEAYIRTDERTFFDYLLRPFSDVVARGLREA